MTDNPFHREQRQSPWGIAFLMATYLRQVVRHWWPLFLVMVVRPSPGKTGMFLLAVLAVALVVLAVAGIRHYHYRFRIEAGQLLIRQGWLQRSRTAIPVERVQAVNLEQTLLHRVTGTCKVMVETAGSSGAEVTLSALRMERAEALREVLTHGPGIRAMPRPVEVTTAAPREAGLLALGVIDLLKIGLSQNHLRTIGIVLLLGLSLLDDLQRHWDLLPEDRLEEVGELGTSLMFLGVLAALSLLAVVVASVVRVMVRYADLVLLFDGRRFRLQSGLLTIREVLIPGRKLQYVEVRANLLQRLFGLFRMSFAQAVPEMTPGQREVMVPGMYRSQRDLILERVFPGESRELACQGGVDSRYRNFLWLWFGLVPALPGAWLLGQQSPWLALAIPIWLVFARVGTDRYTRSWRWHVGPDLLLLRRGWLTHTWLLLPVYKIQSVALYQSPWQRRFGLHTLVLNTAAGDERIPWLHGEDARRLRDWFLYRAESDRRPWM